MHLFLRTLALLVGARRREPLSLWEPASLRLRVLPADADIALHLNNGMYFSFMDLGRFDLMIRSGFWATMRTRGWMPVVGAETISFRKPLALGQKFSLETRVIGLDERAVYFEQRAVAAGEIHASATIATRLVGKHGPVTNAEFLAVTGEPPAGLVLPGWIYEWRANNALPGARRPAPHAW